MSAVEAFAQTPAEPAKKMLRYEREHGGSGGVFRRDPNIWVYTTAVARDAGMPMEWASDELKGVVAAAFRREPEGAEQDCGWGGNKNACSPVMNCVLELYFDRTVQKLPWREGSPVVDFDSAKGYFSSIKHGQLWAFDSVTKTSGRKPRVIFGNTPFVDPETGKDLYWQSVGARQGTGRLQTMAYDREIHGRYSYLKLNHGCGGHPFVNGQTLNLQLEDKMTFKVDKVLYEIYLPAAWSSRAGEVVKQDREQEHNFYKGVWEGMPKGDKP
ncbi:hypothetical protein B9Z41_07915 [Limnohabitans sp. JirII-31]|nr:hypothetical protein B9Z41_07915 [Limnohabitans sp. JirII-31]